MAASPLLLASGSAVRATLLRNAGLHFRARDSRVDEDAVKKRFAGSDTDTLALKLAEEKAQVVSQAEPAALVIGADQILSCCGERYDKPRDMDEARANLKKLRARDHILHSGVALALNGAIVWRHSDRAHLAMRDFSDDFLDLYLATVGDKVRSSVGCYQLEGPGIQLFDRIDGDYFTILGLPLLPLLAELRRRKAVTA
ncbi:MAG: Maf family protein [Parvibaculum sp.]|uniref:Maf family protein n=1 Tax=Parvibaculum sp. TaxID=2024848 RepID=UPI0025F4C6DD|nr:Maf family protein [Parvibaculum sp.]MCE9648080.1 Maf family protein [Parvibaculum sp.]